MEEAGKVFVGWEEVTVSNDRGRREVHYYLRDAGGGMDLAVVGREKSVRHMSYAVPWPFLRSFLALGRGQHLLVSGVSPPPPLSSGLPPLKWRSRREVVDWLSSLVSDSISYGSSPEVDRFSDDEDAEATDIPTSKGLSSGKMGHHSKEFSWLGSAWNCRKRRKHYQSFCRNGITISVHDFVYVMTEENKSLIAYVEDLYEDLRANNMVVVRWFHKADEVGILLPPVINDREIFFSLCLQDFSVECIDGLAAVLSAQHFEKFQNEARHSNWEPYLCRRQIDNDDVKPFDITQLQGYWSQELLRSMFTPSRKLRLKITCGGSRLDGDPNCHVQSGLEKKHRLSSGGIDISGTAARDMNKKQCLGSSSKIERHTSGVISAPGLLRKELFQQKFQQQLSPGCQVEVLSQDSGMRGCWFRCVILRRQHDKVKVRYQDVQDADENGNLEEWVLLSRVAAPDKLGIRMRGRPMVRPNPSESGRLSCSFDVGAVVDAWWHDGWWEGIVIRKQSEGQFHVYFPGEKRVSIFSQGDLRPSLDWISNRWNHIKDRKDVISSLLSDIERENQDLCSGERIPTQSPDTSRLTAREPHNESSAPERNVDSKLTPQRDPLIRKARDVPDLAEACRLDGLKWCSSKKRKRRTEFTHHGPKHRRRRRCEVSSSISREDSEKSGACGGMFMLPKSLTVDHENCKIAGDPLFSAPMTLSSLVMSR